MNVLKRRLQRLSAPTAALLLTGLLAVGVSACGSSSASAPSAANPVNGGVLKVGVGSDLLPSAFWGGSEGANTFVRTLVYQSLVSYPQNSVKPQPVLATSWHLAPDGMSLTLNLRHGVRFSSGRLFTSKDVEFSIKEVVNPKSVAQYARTAAAITGFDTSNPYRIVLKFAHPLSNIFDLLSWMPIVDSRTYGQLVTGGAYVGTGPFKFVSWTPDQQVVFARNPYYWGPRAHLAGVDVSVIPDTSTLVAQMRSGQIDAVYGTTNSENASLVKTGEFQLLKGIGEDDQIYLGINVANKALSNVALRHAIAYAIDRNSIVHDVYSGVGYPVDLPWPKYSLAYWPAGNDRYDYDPSAARQLVSKLGKVPTIPIQYSVAFPDFAAAAQIIQSDLKAVGIDTTIEPVNNAQATQMLTTGTYSGLWLLEHGFADDTPSTLAVTAYPFNAAKNSSNFVSSQYAKDANAAWEVPDGSSKQALAAYRKLSDDLLNDMFLVELADTYEEVVVSDRVHGATDGRNGLDLSNAYLSN